MLVDEGAISVVRVVGNHGSVHRLGDEQGQSIYADAVAFSSPLLQSDYGLVRRLKTGIFGRGNGIHKGPSCSTPKTITRYGSP